MGLGPVVRSNGKRVQNPKGYVRTKTVPVGLVTREFLGVNGRVYREWLDSKPIALQTKPRPQVFSNMSHMGMAQTGTMNDRECAAYVLKLAKLKPVPADRVEQRPAKTTALAKYW